MKCWVNKCINVYSAFYIYATFPESTGSITTPSLVEIMVLSLLIEADNELSCVSNLMSR